MRNTLRLLLIVAGMLTPLAAQAAPPPNNNGANQKQKPNPNQKQQQLQNQQQNQNQNGANQTAQAIQYSVQQLMSLDKNQSGGVEVTEVVNNQVLTLCQNADADKNGTVTATEFTTALTSVATTVNTAGGNSTAAVLMAAGCGQGNNQAGATNTTTGPTARTGGQGQGMGPNTMRGPGGQNVQGAPAGKGGPMQRGPGGPPRR